MKLSEKYFVKRLKTITPEGESWSAYEWEALYEKDAKIYGRICFLEGIIAEWTTEFGTDPNIVSNRNAVLSMQELEKIKKEENL